MRFLGLLLKHAEAHIWRLMTQFSATTLWLDSAAQMICWICCIWNELFILSIECFMDCCNLFFASFSSKHPPVRRPFHHCLGWHLSFPAQTHILIVCALKKKIVQSGFASLETLPSGLWNYVLPALWVWRARHLSQRMMFHSSLDV